MAWKFMGRSGYAEVIERQIELTSYLANRLDELDDFSDWRKLKQQSVVSSFFQQRFVPLTVSSRIDCSSDCSKGSSAEAKRG